MGASPLMKLWVCSVGSQECTGQFSEVQLVIICFVVSFPRIPAQSSINVLLIHCPALRFLVSHYLSPSLPFSSVQFSHSVVSDSLRPHESQHARPPCPSPTPRVYSNSCPMSRWCHPAISSSVVPFSSCPQSLPASGSFPMSQLFAWSGQSIGVSASASVLPMNTQDWSPLGWTGCISLQSKGLSRVSNTTVQKHQFFGTQLSSQSSSHIHTWPLEKPQLWLDRVPNELWREVHDIVQETGIKTIPMEKKCKKAKWLSEEVLQIAVKRREAKSKGEKGRYSHLNAEFQRIARRDKKAFFSDQCKEIEEKKQNGKD